MTKRAEPQTTESVVSRRDFFAGAGMTAGALAAIGTIGGLTHAPAARSAALKNRQYFSTFVALELDGKYAGNLISAEGGEPVIVPTAAVAGTARTTAGATLRYEPLRLRLGEMSAAVFKWIEEASKGAATSRQVAVITHNFDGKETYRLAALDVRLASIMTNGFDAAANEPVRFDVELTPTSSAHVFGGTSNPGVKSGLKAKPMLRSNFRLYVQGYESTTLQVRTVEPFGLRASGPDGTERFGGSKSGGVFIPTPLKFTMAFAHAAPMFDWMNKTLAGKDGPRQAELQILSADLKKAVATVGFANLAILRVSAPAQAGSDVQPFVEVECQPGSVAFNMGELLI